MRVEDIFPPEVIDEDIKKWMGAAAVAGAIAASPMGITNTLGHKDTMEASIAQDISILAQTMWGEARSHGTEGMLAVGHVIKNRASAGKGLTFGNGIRGVALKRKQFSCWNPGDPNRDRMTDMKQYDLAMQTRTPPPEAEEPTFEEWLAKFQNSNDWKEYQMWRQSFDLARKIVYNQVSDTTNGAYFYHTTGVNPKWAQGATPVGRLANHIFYQRVN